MEFPYPVDSSDSIQGILSKIAEGKIDLAIIGPDKADAPGGLESAHAYALAIDESGRIYGTISEDALWESGYSIGDSAAFTIRHPSKTDSTFHLYLGENEIAEIRRRSTVCFNLIPNLIKMHSEESDVSVYDSMLIELPVPKGSTARPHIASMKDDAIIFSLTSRYKIYDEVSPMVGHRIERVELQRRYGDCGEYYKVSITPYNWE